jgi:hypothetical protein
MRNWWNHGLHEKSPSTYCFFVKCSIPQRLDLVQPMKWQTIIHGMIESIPSIPHKKMKSYFDLIHSKLDLYEHLKNAFLLLELAIWKSKISKRLGQNVDSLTTEMKWQCRTDSLSMVYKIVPFVLPFLTDDDGGSNVLNSDDDDDYIDSDDEAWAAAAAAARAAAAAARAAAAGSNDMDDEDESDEDDEGDIEGKNIPRRRRRLR